VCIGQFCTTFGRQLQRRDNGGEFKIPGTRKLADGYDVETKTIYEFYGDYWHGNPNNPKYPFDSLNEFSGKTFRQLHDETLERESLIKSLGYNVITIWESEYKKTLKTSKA
jgi:G:T-mismatch repair DNA endonuclease (very short patch repair protein)